MIQSFLWTIIKDKIQVSGLEFTSTQIV